MPTDLESLPDDAQRVHTTTIPVRWGDMDAAGHVNNSRFFTYFEEARVDWLQSVLGDSVFSTSGPVLASASCEFEQPLRHPATLLIDVYARPPGRSSVENVYVARRDDEDEPIAKGTAVLVWVSAETGKPVDMPDLGMQ